MPAGEHLPHEASAPTNGHSTAHELFALTDEQILEIAPQHEVSGTETVEQPLLAVPTQTAGTSHPHSATPQNSSATSPHSPEATGQGAQAGVPVLPEPPAWLAAQMKDPWSGEEARDLWNGVLQARQEAAAYRSAIATPEDAKALKELYPGGVNEARAAADRARLLDQIDQAYFGTAGKPAEQTSAARAQLAAMMLREDPAAFREMVFAGLRVLEEAEKGTGATDNASTLSRLGQVASRIAADGTPSVAAPFRAASSSSGPEGTQDGSSVSTNSVVGAQHAAPHSRLAL